MEAGRELDALVSEHVMGLPVTFEHENYWPPARPGQNFSTQPIPEYSYDIAAAWTVIDRIKRDQSKDKYGDDFYLRQYNDGWKAGFGTDAPFEGFCEDADAKECETAPLAICLAALKAVGVEV